MGWGDEIMASGHAKVVHKETGKKVIIVTEQDRPRWNEMWNGVPFIVHPAELEHGKVKFEDCAIVKNGSGCRPYIKYPFTREKGISGWSGWRARDHVGVIYMTQSELSFARDALWNTLYQAPSRFCIIEPNVKSNANPNKDWGFHNWQALVDRMPDFPFIQLGPPETRVLRGVHHIRTNSLRDAIAVMSHATLYAGVEGALHHVAGVFRIPGVVYFGGAISEQATGYEIHDNLTGPESSRTPCGQWLPCSHCADIRYSYTPEGMEQRILSKWREAGQYTFKF